MAQFTSFYCCALIFSSADSVRLVHAALIHLDLVRFARSPDFSGNKSKERPAVNELLTKLPPTGGPRSVQPPSQKARMPQGCRTRHRRCT